ncbi:hypothetical protein ACWC2T_36215 [Streptomyces sp. NPDC001393]
MVEPEVLVIVTGTAVLAPRGTVQLSLGGDAVALSGPLLEVSVMTPISYAFCETQAQALVAAWLLGTWVSSMPAVSQVRWK